MYVLELIEFSQISYDIMRGIYRFLNAMYTILLSLAKSTDFTKVMGNDIVVYTEPLYILGGVFMLFRLAVSFLNYIVNPDKVSDNQVGASKVITRVVLSIVLLLLLSPNGFVYKYLSRLQETILNSGVTQKIIGNTSSVAASNLYVNPVEPLIKNANAASIKTCYYYEANGKEIVGFNKLKISSEYFTGATKLTLGTNKAFYAKSYGGTEKFDSSSLTFESYTSIGTNNYYDTSECPTYVLRTDTNKNDVKDKIVLGSGQIPINAERGGFTSIGSMLDNIAKFNYLLKDGSGGYKVTDSDNPNANKDIDDREPGQLSTLGNSNKEANAFTKAIAINFFDCIYPKKATECNETKEKIFTIEGDPEIVDAIESGMFDDSPTLSFSFFPSVLVGIVVIVFVAILCVDVVVRSLKLLALQIMAPIPIVNHIDPNDKIFGEWMKMYLATYADLFIKLIAINLGTVFFGILFKLKLAGIEQIFYIIGILVFVKAAPSMISKLFGIDLAGGTLKDSMGMLKKGLGIGAGAAIGAASGVAGGIAAFSGSKGQGFRNRALAAGRGIGSVFGGAMRGAGAGTKGIGAAANAGKSNFGKSWDRRQKYQEGLTESDLIAGSFAGGALGYAAKVDKANAEKKATVKKLDGFNKKKGAIEDAAESSKLMKTLRQNVANGSLKLNEDQLQDYRDTWAEYQIARKGIDNSSTMQKFKQDLQVKVDQGQLTKEQMGAQIESKTKAMLAASNADLANSISEKEKNTGVKFEVEAGKQAAIMTTMVEANADLEGSKATRDAAGVTSVKSFKELKNANTKVKQEATAISEEIYKSEATDRYQISKDAREAASGKSNQ